MFRGFRDDQKWRNHVKKYNANKDKNDVKELKLFRVCYEARAFQQFIRNEYNVDLDIREVTKIQSQWHVPYYNPSLIKRETGTASKANEMYWEMLQDFDKRQHVKRDHTYHHDQTRWRKNKNLSKQLTKARSQKREDCNN